MDVKMKLGNGMVGVYCGGCVRGNGRKDVGVGGS